MTHIVIQYVHCTSFINCTEEVLLLWWPTGNMLQIKKLLQIKNNCCNLNKNRCCKHKIIAVNKKIVPVNKSSCSKLSDRKVCPHTDGKRRTQYSCTKVKDRPAWTPNVVFVVAATFLFAACPLWATVFLKYMYLNTSLYKNQ